MALPIIMTRNTRTQTKDARACYERRSDSMMGES